MMSVSIKAPCTITATATSPVADMDPSKATATAPSPAMAPVPATSTAPSQATATSTTATPPSQIANSLQIVSWNLDGLSRDKLQALAQFLKDSKDSTETKPAIVFLSEIKTNEKNAHEELKSLFSSSEYNILVNAHKPSCYHGVAMLIRHDVRFQHIATTMECSARSDSKGSDAAQGRVVAVHLLDAKCCVVGTYNPNSGQGLKHVDYRTKQWDPALFSLLEKLNREVAPTLWIGDLNVARAEQDVTDPITMCKRAGFTTLERYNLNDFLQREKWVDVWRDVQPVHPGYTWYGERSAMRLDYCIASPSLAPRVRMPILGPQFFNGWIEVSDHRLVGVTIV